VASDHGRLQTAVKDVSGVSVIKVAGEVDVYTCPDLKTTIYEAISAGATDLVIDMTDVSYMDSSGFGTLLGATRRVKPAGGSVALACCSEAIDRMLRITSLDSVFAIYGQVGEAVNALQTD
jgi:anti-sigma B factor antagonist